MVEERLDQDKKEQRSPGEPKGNGEKRDLRGKMGRVFKEISKRVAIENIEPDDPLLALFPGIVKDHLIRYRTAGKMAKEILPNTEPLTVVDLASGRGYGAGELKNILPEGTQVLGVEIGHDYVVKAAQKYNPNNEGYPYFIQGDVKHIPLKNNSADVITAFEITEHLPRGD